MISGYTYPICEDSSSKDSNSSRFLKLQPLKTEYTNGLLKESKSACNGLQMLCLIQKQMPK